ncbi:MAG TPA: EAL domain-containing response regulator [Alphaproteobacteria bacterium]|nr:EAL domain-containing response regulator [Alphaproteobacteria bacterium]
MTSTSPNRLLIIDDDPQVARFVAKVAKACDYEAITTTSAEDFRARHGTWHPTHIVMDLQMPNTDGVELIRFLAAEKSKARLLIMSGQDVKVIEAVKHLGKERGLTMAGILSKPIRAAELRAILTNLKLASDVVDEDALARAIQNGELFLLYQPKIEVHSRRLAGFEALVRWQHPSRGIIPPTEFIPLAEQSGLIDRLTQEVAKLALHQLSLWRGQNLEVGVAFNISGRNLSNVGFADELASFCRNFGVRLEWVTLELTETAAAANAANAMDILSRLRLKGCRISIDDFGTGYSSMKQLQRLPFSELKVDMEFVRGCVASAGDRIIVKAIIDLAHNLGLIAVAEGVEDQATLEVLAELGCDLAQGYFISRPLSAEQTAEWVRNCASGALARVPIA